MSFQKVFPSGINKIIEEYCNYPKKYIEELESHTSQLKTNIDDCKYDISYLWISIKNLLPKPFLSFLSERDDIRNFLIDKQHARELEYGIKYNQSFNKCYYTY